MPSAREEARPQPRDAAPAAPGTPPAAADGAAAPAYVVVARERRVARAQRGADWRATAKQEWTPVGIRHAVPAVPRTLHTEAVCGADIREWHSFWEQPFSPMPGSSCQRCLQVLARKGVRLVVAPREDPFSEV